MLFRSSLRSLLAAAPLQDTAHLVLVATTDVHGHATGWDYVADRPFPGGLARAATVVDSLRAALSRARSSWWTPATCSRATRSPTYFARVAPRDPHPIVEAMNQVGYDAATPGNHDFDWGCRSSQRAVADARLPLRERATSAALSGDTPALPAATVVLQRAGRPRSAITGLHHAGRDGLGPRTAPRPGAGGADRADGAARDCARCGGSRTSSSPWSTAGWTGAQLVRHDRRRAENVAAALAGLRPGPTSWWSGHSHREMRDSVLDGVHFVQPKPYAPALAVAHVDLAPRRRAAGGCAGSAGSLVSTRERRAVAAARAAAGARPATRCASGRARRSAVAAAPMPRPAPRGRSRRRSSTSSTRSSGGGRAPSSRRPRRSTSAPGSTAGQHPPGDVLALYPYENTLRAVRHQRRAAQGLSRAERALLPGRSGRAGSRLNDSVPGYNYDMVAGATYEIDLRQPVGEPDPEPRRARAGRSQPADSFTLALNSYRQTGGGGYKMLRGRAGGLRQGREHPRTADRGGPDAASPIDPAQLRRRDWRIVPEVADRAVRGLFGVPRGRRRGRGRATPILLRVLATGRSARGAADARRGAALAAAHGQPGRRVRVCPRSGSTPATRCRARRVRT